MPVEFSFPAADSQNVTDFLKEYNALSPYKNAERLKREYMIAKSNLTCVYWREDAYWSKDGCELGKLDSTHVKCICTHLGIVSISFTTPKLSIDAPILENTT